MRHILAMLIGVGLALLVTSTDTNAEPRPQKGRTAVIDGPIYADNLSEVEDALDKWSRTSRKPIDLIINSPGGSVYTGFKFINRMRDVQSRRITIRCFVPEVAASMAFQILMNCDRRYVLERSFLLWHRVRMRVNTLTAPLADSLSRDMHVLDSLIIDELSTSLSEMDRRDVLYHLENETFHLGVVLARAVPRNMTSYKSIYNLYSMLESSKVPRTQSNFFIFQLELANARIPMYITEDENILSQWGITLQ